MRLQIIWHSNQINLFFLKVDGTGYEQTPKHLFGGLDWEHFSMKAHTFQGYFLFLQKTTLPSKLILYPDIKPQIYGNWRLMIDKIIEFLIFQVHAFSSLEGPPVVLFLDTTALGYTLPFSVWHYVVIATPH